MDTRRKVFKWFLDIGYLITLLNNISFRRSFLEVVLNNSCLNIGYGMRAKGTLIMRF